MTARSTRIKLRFQVYKAMADCDRVQGHLQNLDEIAEGKSDYINTYLPTIVLLVEDIKKMLTKFREGM